MRRRCGFGTVPDRRPAVCVGGFDSLRAGAGVDAGDRGCVWHCVRVEREGSVRAGNGWRLLPSSRVLHVFHVGH